MQHATELDSKFSPNRFDAVYGRQLQNIIRETKREYVDRISSNEILVNAAKISDSGKMPVQRQLENITVRVSTVKTIEEVEDLKTIIDVVCSVCGVSFYELKTKSRDTKFVMARKIVSLYSRWHTSFGVEDLGMLFNRDHSSLTHASQRICMELQLRDSISVRTFTKVNINMPNHLQIKFIIGKPYYEQLQEKFIRHYRIQNIPNEYK